MAVTREASVPNPGVVQVNTKKGEYLFFSIQAKGPVPIFSFSSSVAGSLKAANKFTGHPLKVYEWERLKIPSEVVHLELLDLLMAFLTSASYTYHVEVRNAEDIPIKTVLDVTFTSNDPKDTASESFNVVTT